MIATDVIRTMKQKRNVTWQQLGDSLGAEPYTIPNRLRVTKNLGTRQLYECADSMDYYVVVVPKEDFDFNQYPNAIKVDLYEGEFVELGMDVKYRKEKRCPFCGHELKPKETKYSGCPYCLKAWGNSYKLQKDNDVVIGQSPDKFVPHKPAGIKDLDNVRAEFGEKSSENILDELTKEL